MYFENTTVLKLPENTPLKICQIKFKSFVCKNFRRTTFINDFTHRWNRTGSALSNLSHEDMNDYLLNP